MDAYPGRVAIPSSSVGSTASLTADVDARWLMSYAAGIGDHRPAFLDPSRAGGIVGHPVFAVCPEWPVIIAVGRAAPVRDTEGATRRTEHERAERARAVHATHDLHVHRLVRPGDTLTTTGTVVGVEHHRAGVLQTLRLDTVDGQGAPVATTWQGSMFLGAELDGAEVLPGAPETVTPDGVDDEAGTGAEIITVHRSVDRGAAHVYTECARIWNPIHTDTVVARAAGLPDIILHGTATMALAVSAVIDRFAEGDPALVRRVVGRFAGMVVLPSELVVRMVARENPSGTTLVSVDVVAESQGASPVVAFRHGAVVLGRPEG